MAENVYILRVRLSWAKGVWREIAILGKQTLTELHRAILEAFEWTDNDDYSFYLGDDIRDKGMLLSPALEDRNPEHITIDDLELEEDLIFIYVFGEGERNQFIIKVMTIEDPESGTTYPDVVDEKGESPDQELAYLED